MMNDKQIKVSPKVFRVKKFLRAHGLDGALVLSPENFHYITGFAGHQHTVSRKAGFSFAVLSSADAVPTLLGTMDFESPTFEAKLNELRERNDAAAEQFQVYPYSTWVGARSWKEFNATDHADEKAAWISSNALLQKLTRQLGLDTGSIGIELDYLPVSYERMLKESFPSVHFVDISSLFLLSRSVKTTDEIDVFRTLCNIADEGFFAVSQLAGPGVSERELQHCFQRSVIASGICVPSDWSMFSSGESGARLGLPGSHIIQSNEVVKFDAGVNAAFDFYTTDTSRSWVMKDADPALMRLKDRLYEGQRRMIASAKPGMSFHELFHIGFDFVKAQYPNYRRGHCGHSISIGPATAEEPFISDGVTRPLEPGMVLAMEVPCYLRGFNGFNIEDMVLITENGAEVLTPKTPHYL